MRVITAYDHTRQAITAYNANRDPVARLADLSQWRDLDLPVCHGIIAGPPCQDASVLTKNKGRPDKGRSSLYTETARIVAALRPEWAIIENVPNMRNQPEYHHALEILTEAGYWITVHAMLHADFGGLTTRKRLFLVAARRMLPMPAPILTRKQWRAHGPALEPFLATRPPDGWGRWNLDKARVGECPAGVDATFSGSWFGWKTYRLWSDPYRTITSGGARDKARWRGQVWMLNAQECGVLQGFVPDYTGLTRLLAGNTVPPEMARVWGEMIHAVYGDRQEVLSLFCGAGGFDHLVDV